MSNPLYSLFKRIYDVFSRYPSIARLHESYRKNFQAVCCHGVERNANDQIDARIVIGSLNAPIADSCQTDQMKATTA